MTSRDWLVTAEGKCHACSREREWDLLQDPYRFHRFLTEIEDVLAEADGDPVRECTRLPEIRRLVRKLMTNSYWIETQYLEPDPKTGVSVLVLYDEIGYPLTVQIVTFAPGMRSNVHKHGTWGVVAVLKGEEKNTFWRRVSHPEFPDRIEAASEIILHPGDIISFTPDAIHCVEALGYTPTVTFNLYGETDRKQRFEFDLIRHTAKNF
jgi:predicted metal-dependent enzyme (double-stranded beta helix superfamily)